MNRENRAVWQQVLITALELLSSAIWFVIMFSLLSAFGIGKLENILISLIILLVSILVYRIFVVPRQQHES